MSTEFKNFSEFEEAYDDEAEECATARLKFLRYSRLISGLLFLWISGLAFLITISFSVFLPFNHQRNNSLLPLTDDLVNPLQGAPGWIFLYFLSILIFSLMFVLARRVLRMASSIKLRSWREEFGGQLIAVSSLIAILAFGKVYLFSGYVRFFVFFVNVLRPLLLLTVIILFVGLFVKFALFLAIKNHKNIQKSCAKIFYMFAILFFLVPVHVVDNCIAPIDRMPSPDPDGYIFLGPFGHTRLLPCTEWALAVNVNPYLIFALISLLLALILQFYNRRKSNP